MEYTEVIKNRRAVRSFSRRQVAYNDLVQVIVEAQHAPSWANAQEHKVYIAAKDVARRIREEFIERSEQGLIGISDYTFTHREEWSRNAQNNMELFEHGMERHMGDEFNQFVHAQDTLFDAPALCYLTVPKDTSKWALIDLGAYEMSILLSAANMGIDSIVAYAFVKHPDIIRKHLPIPETEDIAIGIGLGYAEPEAKINKFRSSRVDVSNILNIRE